MNRFMIKRKIPLIIFYQKLMVLFAAALIIGNTFRMEPLYYISLIVSIFAVFFHQEVLIITILF